MRPRYEVPVDLENEKKVIEALGHNFFFGTLFSKSTDPAVDYVSTNSTPQVHVEIKRRNGSAMQHAEYLISSQKVRTALKLGGDFYMVWAWDDAICVRHIKPTESFREAIGGRTVQTRDNFDIERVLYVPRTTCTFVAYDGAIKFSPKKYGSIVQLDRAQPCEGCNFGSNPNGTIVTVI